MQSAYLCVIFHVKHKKSPFIAHLTWFLILGKIQQGGQDGVHCWLRHRPPAAPPPIKYTSSCREDQRLSIQLARGSREFTCFCLHKKWMPQSYLGGGGGFEGFNWLSGAFASYDLFHNGVTSFRVLNMWRTLSNVTLTPTSPRIWWRISVWFKYITLALTLTLLCVRIINVSTSVWRMELSVGLVKQWVNRENGLKKEWQCVCCSSLRLWFL